MIGVLLCEPKILLFVPKTLLNVPKILLNVPRKITPEHTKPDFTIPSSYLIRSLGLIPNSIVKVLLKCDTFLKPVL